MTSLTQKSLLLAALAKLVANIPFLLPPSYTLPTATLTIDDVGSYEYGDKATGITFAVGSVKLAEGADPDTAANYTTNASVMAKDSTITLKASGDKVRYADTSKSYTFSGTASYAAGKVPVTNLGNEYATAQIPAGDVTIADKTVTFSGYRYAFAGGTTAATLDSATVRAASAGSHQNKGWEQFTDAVIRILAKKRENLVFILWGSYAQKKGAFIDRNRHLVLTSAHPSPLSAYNGFFGNKHFSRANEYLVAHGQEPICW